MLQLRRYQRLRIRDGDRHRIARYIVDAEFIMYVRPGGPAGLADIADHFALADFFTLVQAGGKPAHVAVQRRIMIPVLDADHVAVAGLGADEIDYAVA